MSRLALAWLLLLAAGGALAAPSPWTTVDSPNATVAPTELTAVTCVSESDCWALGKAGGGFDLNTMMAHWDGVAWRTVASPGVSDDATHILEDVACSSSASCWAVGYYFVLATFEVSPLVLHWDGEAWRLDTSLGPGSGWSRLNGVSCASGAQCWAVGSDAGDGPVEALIARWDGAAWTRHAPPATGLSTLHDVACAAAQDCWAVGSSGLAGAAEATLALHWNGAAWAVTTSPNAAATVENVLAGVTCTSGSACVAAGRSFDGAAYAPLILHWSGASWTTAPVVATPGAQSFELADVACASAADCWAVGFTNESDIDRPVALHYNGIAWIPDAAPPDLNPTYSRGLAAAACTQAGCWAVGTLRPAGNARPHIQRWNGIAWSEVPAPAGAATQSNSLRGLDCLSATDCWAVGMYFSGSLAVSLIQHWDGVSWQIAPSPNTAPDRNTYVKDIDCVAASDCWAVGSSANTIGVEGQPLALHWDGVLWSIVQINPVDTRALQSVSLTAVKCVSSTDCWAVGHAVEQYYRGVILHWDGTSWTPVVVPHQGLPSEGNALYGLTCVTADDCWAVGDQWTANGPFGAYLTVVLHWDGASWSTVESPNVSLERDNRLFGIACPAADDCWAVGNANRDNGDKSLVIHWNGAAWQLAAPPASLGFLYDVRCPSSSDCWAVGHPWRVDGGQSPRTLTAHWDGNTWSIVEAPRPGATSSLDAIACLSVSECWTVGSYSVAGRSQTLALRLTPPFVDPFGFIERTGVATGAWITSEAVTLTGSGGPLPLFLEGGGQYRIDSGAWTSAPGEIAAGSRLALRHASAAAAGTPTGTVVTVGTYRTTFRSVTSAVDRTPDPFTFGSRTGVEGGTVVTSDPVAIEGFNTALAIVPGLGVEYRVGDGPWTSGNGTLPYTTPRTTITLRHTASVSPLSYTRSYLKVGGVAGYFTTRTR